MKVAQLLPLKVYPVTSVEALMYIFIATTYVFMVKKEELSKNFNKTFPYVQSRVKSNSTKPIFS